MTEQIKDGGPAFPVSTSSKVSDVQGPYGHQDGPHTWQFPGMTLRDFFAGEALNGLLSDSATMGNISKDAKELKVNPAIYIASASYEFADAMLKAREVGHD